MKRMFIAIAVVVMVATVGFTQTLTAYVLQSAPLGFVENGAPKGEHYDYLQRLADRVGVTIEAQVVPKSRLIAGLENGDVDLAITFRSARWDSFVEWCGLIRQIRIVGVNRNGLPLNGLEDLHNSNRVGVLANSFVSPEFDNDGSIPKYTVPNYDTMVQLLASGRIDTAVGNAISISYNIDRQGVAGNIQSDSGITLGTQQQWLAFTSASDHHDLMPAFAQAIEDLRAEGVMDEILTSYAGTTWRELNAVE